MATLPDMTAAPRTIRFGDREYLLSPLTWADWGEFTAWSQDCYLDTERRLAAHLDDDDRRAHMKAAVETARAIDETSPELQKVAKTIGGMARLLWMSLRAKHAEVTHAQVTQWIFDEGVRAAAMNKFNEANFAGMPESSAEKKTEATVPASP